MKWEIHETQIEHELLDESQKRRRIFLINTSKKVAELQKPGTQGFKNECTTLCSSLEAIFIVSWDPKTNLETELDSITKTRNQSCTHKILTNFDMEDSS